MKREKETIIDLPLPHMSGTMSLEETLIRRRSVRRFSTKSLTDEEISQLMWAGQGKTSNWGGRTAPSAGARYPLELYIALPEGVYHYDPDAHSLVLQVKGDIAPLLARAALGQRCVQDAPAVIVITAVIRRTAGKYGARGERYVTIEVGHAAENILLQAVSLRLGAVPVGAFHDDDVRQALRLPEDHTPLYLIPVGHEK
jgi:SagB-type dehydrogenase family enzyme